MNQILSVDKIKKKKRTSISSIIMVFAIILIIFGLGVTSTGVYSCYKAFSNNIDENVMTTNTTKPTITTERENATTINIVVTHDKEIASLTYKINNEQPIEVEGNGGNELKQEVELPSGSVTIEITAKDTEGITSSYENTFEVEDKPTIKLEQVEGKIKATVECSVNLDYVMYYWDEDESNAIKGTINQPKAEAKITVLEGTHTLNIIAVDENGVQTKKSQKIIGDNAPELEITTDGQQFIIKGTDDESLAKVEITLNSDEMKTETIEGKEYSNTIQLQNGENKLTVTIYNKNGLAKTSKVKYVKE